MSSSPVAEAIAKCPNCGARRTGAWCADCGQESLGGPHASVRTIRRQWERIRHSAVALVFHPGQLTAEFRDGQRARSVTPWRLAINLVTFFFLLSFVTDFRVANLARQDAGGPLTGVISEAASLAHVDVPTYIERVDRRFDAIYTAMIAVLVAIAALTARLTHWRHGARWSVHFVLALHLIAWSFIVNFIYLVAMRVLNLSPFMFGRNPSFSVAGAALLFLVLAWQFAYVLVAFRRVYGDTWMGGSAKAAVMVAVKLVAGNALAVLSFWLAVQSLLHVN
jgi:hypothetical protein